MKLFNIKNLVARFRKDEKGATLVEYGIALVIAVTVGASIVGILGDSVSAKFDSANVAVNQ
ncbi:Flp family type IVb pilin [Sinirhodobacter sp. WL0062]|uniref:Flp family type IVb pilin n=1 Tax=Rhodobacter flavimaris TaxID=2907145 RepID=A0ABS8YQ66_9RHOB|nr:Flp family type IVb pilin [Sinirhodobacter sp. WL0062]MCE5972022.1 Flp family type IVb pilin [Sinirhodobacter sp. WL0062]